MPAIPPNSLIVVTGITGYIASHVGLVALQAGYRVRGTVRSLVGRAEELKASYAKHGADVSRLEFVILDDVTSHAQLEKAFQSADGVAHVALPGDYTDKSDDIVQKAVASAIAVLQTAAKVQTVKRVVFTSSSVAVIEPPDFKEHTLTDKDWNEASLQRYERATEEEKQKPHWAWLRYTATKLLSERAAWKWVEENKPAFDIVTILPNANLGPVLYGQPRSTVAWIYTLLQGDTSLANAIPPQWFVDVRDDARLHVLALTTPSLSGKRMWAVAEPFGWNKIITILRKHFPQLKLTADIPGEQGEVSPQKIDNTVATEVLGSWISLEQSLVDTAKAFGF